MRELSLNILDICKNSTKAGATRVEISLVVEQSQKGEMLKIQIEDNGCGMDEEFLKSVCDPFTTTRTTRKVGMGIPLFKMASEMAEGEFSITSKVGEGTVTTATFLVSSVDRMPLGDVASTMQLLIMGNSEIDFLLHAEMVGNSFDFSSFEVAQIVGAENITSPEVMEFIYEMIKENTTEIFGGKI